MTWVKRFVEALTSLLIQHDDRSHSNFRALKDNPTHEKRKRGRKREREEKNAQRQSKTVGKHTYI